VPRRRHRIALPQHRCTLTGTPERHDRRLHHLLLLIDIVRIRQPALQSPHPPRCLIPPLRIFHQRLQRPGPLLLLKLHLADSLPQLRQRR